MRSLNRVVCDEHVAPLGHPDSVRSNDERHQEQRENRSFALSSSEGATCLT